MFDHILVPLDGSALAECVLPHVAAFATLGGARVTVARVLEPPTLAGQPRPTDALAWQLARDEARAYLAGVQRELAPHDVDADTRVFEGQPAGALIGYAHDHDVDLIALSSHGQSGLLGWNLGAVGHKLLFHAKLSLLLVRAFEASVEAEPAARRRPTRYRRIVVPLDGSARAECAVPPAVGLADAHGATLVLAHVVAPPELCCPLPPRGEEAALVARLTEANARNAQRYLDERRNELAGGARRVETRVARGDDRVAALHQLVDDEDADLVALGAHGATGSSRWPYGSTVLNVLAYGSTPLLVVQDLDRREVKASVAERAAQERPGHG